MTGALSAGEVGFRPVRVVPEPLDGAEQVIIARFDRDIGRPAEQVQLAHGVAGRGGRVPHRHLVQVVAGAERARSERPVTAALDHPGRQLQVAAAAGLAPQLDQGHLDLRVPVDRGPAALSGAPGRAVIAAEPLDEQVGETPGHLEEPAVATAGRCHPSLDQMAGAVHLVPVRQVRPRFVPVQAEPRVQVPVLALGLGYQVHQGVVGRAQLIAGFELPPDTLERLIDVGIGKPHAAARAVELAGFTAEVVQRTALGELTDTVRDGGRPVEDLPGPEPAPGIEADGVVAEGAAGGAGLS
jgi:hypothetical protein